MRKNCMSFSAALVVFASFFLTAASSYAEITRLTVDARISPTIGIDSLAPEFGWELTTDRYFDVDQTWYSLEVASSMETLESGRADMWKSGEVASDRSFGVSYEGKPLRSSTRYFWRVSARWSGFDVERNKVEKTESAVGEFVTGVMSAEEWQASWIACERTNADPMPVFFRNFTLDQKKENVAEAFLHVCGLGQQIVSVNSIRVSDHSSVDPGWTNYKKSCLYTTFDVKKELTSSDDCSLSVALG
ncbi:MAG: alpha-L-rhamnosidase N-terminal domain-containing protein, partial [Thermoguttaceae bacterium]|nr:alpha-L-rhamnosidase N-terminal domain-containing protein [Thermoguttaceae bacterium]